jgi:hypothetical protein
MAKTSLKLSHTDKLDLVGTKVLLYGTNGSGKTHFAATWPFPVFFTPVMAANELRTISNQNIPVVLFDTMAELKEQTSALGEAMKRNEVKCKTIIVDNLTTIQTLFEVEIKAKSGKDKLEWEDWGKFTTFFVEWMTLLHRWPVNVIWITHSDAEKTFTLRGDSKHFIPGNSDLLLYCEAKDMGATKPTAWYVHGRRCGQWPARIRMPDIQGQKPFTMIGPDPHYDDLAKLLGMPSQAQAEGWE